MFPITTVRRANAGGKKRREKRKGWTAICPGISRLQPGCGKRGFLIHDSRSSSPRGKERRGGPRLGLTADVKGRRVRFHLCMRRHPQSLYLYDKRGKVLRFRALGSCRQGRRGHPDHGPRSARSGPKRRWLNRGPDHRSPMFWPYRSAAREGKEGTRKTTTTSMINREILGILSVKGRKERGGGGGKCPLSSLPSIVSSEVCRRSYIDRGQMGRRKRDKGL